MRVEGFRLQLGMELYADEPWMPIEFDDFRQLAVGRQAGDPEPRGFQPLAVIDVDLVAVAMAFEHRVGAEDFRGLIYKSSFNTGQPKRWRSSARISNPSSMPTPLGLDAEVRLALSKDDL